MSQLVEKAVHGGDVWSYFPVIDFSSNVNPLGPPESVVRAIKDNLWRISYYPDDQGKELKEILADKFEAEENLFIIGNGSTEIIKIFSETFIGKGDKVVIPAPTYSEYGYQARIRGAVVEFIPPKEDLSFDVERILSSLESGVRVLFLCNPNNPTGRGLERKVIQRILEAAWEGDVHIFLDEAYVDFGEKPPLSRPWEYDNLLVSRSLTKLYTLPGLRLGYAMAGEKIVRQLERLRIPWNVNVLAQIAGAAALSDSTFVRETRRFLKKEKELFQKELSNTGLLPLPSETNFFLVRLEGLISSPELKARLLDRRILIRDCSSFESLGTNYIRLSVKLRGDNLRLVREVKKLLEGR